MDKFRAMQAFSRIADEGSLTAAARVLGSSLPAVVRLLAAYETDLGVRLFSRTTRRISLTEEGRQHLVSCRQVLAAVEDAEAAICAGVGGEPAGHLIITASVLFGQMYVAPVVTRFVQQHEKMRCSVLLVDRMVDLLDESVDVGIRIGQQNDSSLVALPIGRTRRVVVANPAYLRKHGVPRHPRDLHKADCIRSLPDLSTWGGFRENGRSFQVPVTGKLEFNCVLPAVEACAGGGGFGMFLSHQVAPFLADERLKIVLQGFEPPPCSINLVYPRLRLLPARTRVFIDWIFDQMKDFRT